MSDVTSEISEVAWFEVSWQTLNSRELAFKLTDQALSAALAEVWGEPPPHNRSPLYWP